MKSIFRFLFFALLLFSLGAKAQRVTDTMAYYEGSLVRMQLHYNAAGQLEQKNVYRPNGALETIYFYSEGINSRWIGFDQQGKRSAEWNDPTPDQEKEKKQQYLLIAMGAVFLISFAFLLFRRMGDKKAFLFFGFLTLIASCCLPLVAKLLGSMPPKPALFTNAVLVFLPFMMCFLAVRNLFQRKEVPLILTLLFLLAGAVMAAFYGTGIYMRGLEFFL